MRLETCTEIEDAVLGLDGAVRVLVITWADPTSRSGDDVRAIKNGLRRALDPDWAFPEKRPPVLVGR